MKLCQVCLFFLCCTGFLCAQPATKAIPSKAAALASVQAIEEVLTTVISQAEPSIVAITRLDERTANDAQLPQPRFDPTSDDFLADHYGTGIVIDKRGLILTAAHVVKAKSTHWVTLANRKRYKARIKAADPRSDLAVLEIEANDLKPITLGSAANLKKGQFAIVLGNPYAIARDGSPSAALGMIANLGRKLPSETGRDKLYHYATLIQTDAQLNLGTSGGALLNLQGELIGVTTSLATLSGYEQAAGYALPVDETFRRVVDTLKQGREVEYGFLGIKPENLANDDTTEQNGVRVLDVVSGTPAQRMGMQVGDIVTHINNQPIQTTDDLVLKVGQYPIDATVQVKFMRQRRVIESSIELTKFPVKGEKIVTQASETWRGMTLDYSTTRPKIWNARYE